MASITQRCLVPVSTVSARNAWQCIAQWPPFCVLNATNNSGRGVFYFQKNWVGVCGTLPETITLFQTKICDFLYPVSDLFQNLITWSPIARRVKSCYGNVHGSWLNASVNSICAQPLRSSPFFLPWMANSRGWWLLICQIPQGGDAKRGQMPLPLSTLQQFSLIAQSNSAILSI